MSQSLSCVLSPNWTSKDGIDLENLNWHFVSEDELSIRQADDRKFQLLCRVVTFSDALFLYSRNKKFGRSSRGTCEYIIPLVGADVSELIEDGMSIQTRHTHTYLLLH